MYVKRTSCSFELYFTPGQDSHLWFGFGFGNFHLKIPIFQFFAIQVKKTSSCRVKKYPGQTRVSLFLLWVKSMLGSGQGPSLV